MGWNDHEWARTVQYHHHVVEGFGGQRHSLSHLVGGLVEIKSVHGDYANIVCPSPGCRKKDTRLYMPPDKPPFIFCFSESCREHNGRVSHELEQRARQLGWIASKPTEEDLETREWKLECWRTEKRYAQRVRPRLLEKEPIPLADWEPASPFPVHDFNQADHWRLLLAGLYEPRDYVWMGERWDVERSAFDMVEKWLKRGVAMGQLVSTCTFLNPSWGRKKVNVLYHRYLVMESDNTPPDQFGTIALWGWRLLRTLDKTVQLRAVVHTGTPDPNRSPHFWFDRPVPPATSREAKDCPDKAGLLAAWQQRHDMAVAMLSGVGCDHQMLRAFALTARCPGTPRLDKNNESTGLWQRLLYLDPQFEITPSNLTSTRA